MKILGVDLFGYELGWLDGYIAAIQEDEGCSYDKDGFPVTIDDLTEEDIFKLVMLKRFPYLKERYLLAQPPKNSLFERNLSLDFPPKEK